MKIPAIFAAAWAAAIIATAMPAFAQNKDMPKDMHMGQTVTPTFQQPITNIPEKSLIAVFVDYAPGGASPSHVHAKSVFIFGYVLSGEIESQVNDGPKRVYREGKLLRDA